MRAAIFACVVMLFSGSAEAAPPKVDVKVSVAGCSNGSCAIPRRATRKVVRTRTVKIFRSHRG